MNWKTIPKQQRDLIVLGIMGVVTVFFVLTNLVLTPAKAKAAEARKTVTDLSEKVRKAQNQMKWDQRNQSEMKDIASKLLKSLEVELPPEGSRYLWAHKQLSDIAYRQGLVLQIREVSETRTSALRSADTAFSSLEWAPYSVEVSLNASYDELKNYLVEIMRGNAYASLGALEISSQADSNLKHSIRMSIQWPIPLNQRAEPFLRGLTEDPQ